MDDDGAMRWREAAEGAKGDETVAPAVVRLLAALDSNPGDSEEAARVALAALLEVVSQNYFAQPWAPELEFSVWARLTDDPRAWGYGSEEEIAPLRWLTALTGHWYDGIKLLPTAEWQERFDSWAEGQRDIVRRVMPGALSPEPFLRGD